LTDDNSFSMKEFQQRKQAIMAHSSYPKFDESMRSFIEFFDSLDSLVWGKAIPFMGNKKTFIFDTQLIQSAKYTLNSIKLCFEYGSASDANTLIRKFRDDLFFYLYILEVNNNQVVLFDQNRRSEIKSHNRQVDFVIKWFNNELKNFDFNKNIISYLKKNSNIKEVIEKHNLEDAWKKIFKNLNNYVHNNGVSYCEINYLELEHEVVEKVFTDIVVKVEYITVVFMTLFILIKPHYIMASGYIDYLEIDLEPPIDSQYWVASFIQEFIDEKIAKHNPDLKLFLKEKVYMDIK